MAAPQASSRLEMLQARFQQRQLIEKEQKLLQLYDQQQLRAHQVAQRGSAGSNCSNSSGHGSNGTTTHHHQTVTRTSTTTQSTSNSQGGGKVRQMFDERRQTSVKGIDKSYPLEPLDNRSRKQQTAMSNVVVSSTSPTKNGIPMSNRQSVVTRRTVRSEANSNINGGKPIVSYHEEVTRECCGPTEGLDEPEEFGDENDEVSRFANGNSHIDQRNEIHIEDVANENTTQRHRTTAKIHLAGFGSDSGTNVIGDDMDNEQLADAPLRSVPDRLPRRGPAAKKPSQAEARFERFKNTNTNRPPGKTTKQVAGNTTSFTKKRTETTTNSGSSSRASTVTRTMDEDISRARSTSPDLGSRTGRPRSSSPELADGRSNSTSPLVDRRSLVTKSSSGISKVSQLTHKNSMDFYPRRKSEFEKSKTFRKLQLELGESSPEPTEPEPETTGYTRQCRKRGSILAPNIYTVDRRSSSSNPAADRDHSRDRMSRDRTPESPKPESPIHRRKSATTHDDSRTIGTESSVYSCQRRETSFSYLTTDRDLAERADREKSPERSQSRRGSASPIWGRRSSLTREVMKRSSVEDSTYSSRRRSSSTSPIGGERRASHDKSAERPRSRGSESPICGRSSPTHEEMKRPSYEATTYSSRRRSVSPVADRQRASEESSPERPGSRRGSESPIYRRRSTVTTEEITSAAAKMTNIERRVAESIARKRSESPRGDSGRSSIDRERSKLKTNVRKKSGETLRSFELVKKIVRRDPEAKTTSANRSWERKTTLEDVEFPVRRIDRKDPRKRTKSPEHKIVKKDRVVIEGRKTKVTDRMNIHERNGGSKSRTTSPSPPRSTSVKERNLSEVESSVDSDDRKDPKRRTKSPGYNIVKVKCAMETSRSVTDRKNHVSERSTRSRSRTTSPSPRSTSVKERTLSETEFPVHSDDRKNSKRRTKSPEHKKEKVAMEPSRKERRSKGTDRKDSETDERKARSRSRTVSPSPISTSMKETASFRAKKIERRDSVEARRRDSKDRQERIDVLNKINLTHGRRSVCEEVPKARSPSAEENRTVGSRRSSSETIVKRHGTFRVNRPSQRIMDGESSVATEAPLGKSIGADSSDKSQLLERIENIRTTISRSGGRSVQSLDSKDFERTDSVESALKRFDSIGVETEHRLTVGVDEPDVLPVDSSREVTLRDVEKIGGTKSVDSRYQSGKTAVVSAKAERRKVNGKTRVPSGEKLFRTGSESAKSTKITKEKSTRATTPRRSEDKVAEKSRVGRKIGTSIVRKSMLRQVEPSGRGEGKESDRSPLCKRRLFDDSESEIDTDNSRSTVVLSTIITVKRPDIVKTETIEDRDDVEVGDTIARSQSSIDESRADFEQPAKVLRSIEDIRQSIQRESQDFNRELCKFKTAMRRDAERSASTRTDSTVRSGIISRIEIKKTLKAGAEAPIVEIKRSTVKLPIAHRVAKSPSPDIGTKRTTDHRARTPTASIRRSAPSSPAQSPDGTTRYGSAELKSTGSKILSRPSTSPPSLREDGNRSGSSRTSVHLDFTDGPGNNFQSTVTESVFSVATKSHEAFVVELDDDEVSPSKDIGLPKPLLPKKSSNTSLTTSQKQQRSPTGTPLPRPTSALSIASSTGSARCQSKIGMATKTKSPTSTAPKVPPGSARVSTAAAVNDGLAGCKICGRRFNSDRINLHEQICSKTATKKRKQFDATIHRVKGTELEPFVKKAGSKKPQTDRKSQKPEVKSNWRRKHEDFINAIRSAKQVQAHLAAGGKLSDLPPPPASDTSDYVQCPHCGRKFNQGAAERHIPKCQNMLHNKPNPRAPPKPKR